MRLHIHKWWGFVVGHFSWIFVRVEIFTKNRSKNAEKSEIWKKIGYIFWTISFCGKSQQGTFVERVGER